MIATETLASKAEIEPKQYNSLDASGERPPVTLWLVDDNDMFREVLNDNFSLEANINCTRQFSSAEALIAALQGETAPDAILLDVNMRGMSGVEALPSIKALAPATRVLMLTTFFDSIARTEAMRAGAAGFLLKNYEFHRIAASVLETTELGSENDNTDTLSQTQKFKNAPAAAVNGLSREEVCEVPSVKPSDRLEYSWSGRLRSLQRLFRRPEKRTVTALK